MGYDDDLAMKLAEEYERRRREAAMGGGGPPNLPFGVPSSQSQLAQDNRVMEPPWANPTPSQPPAPPPAQEGPPTWQDPLPQRQSPFDLSPEVEQHRRAGVERGYYDSQLDMAKMEQKQRGDEIMMKANEENESSFKANAEGREADEEQYRKDADQIYSQIQRDAGQVIDPGAFFREKSAWDNIGMAISMALAGYLNPRGPNMALEIIEKNLDRWIDAKKTNIENKRKEGYEKIQALQGKAAVMNRLRDTAEWKRATVYEMAANQAKLVGEQTTDKIIKARSDQFQAMARENAAKEAYQAALKGGAWMAGIMRAKISAGPGYAAVSERGREFNIALPGKSMDTAWDNRNNDARIQLMRERVNAAGGAGNLVPLQDVTGEIMGHVRKQDWDESKKTVLNFRSIDEKIGQIQDLGGGRDLWERRPDLLNLGSEETHQLKVLYNNLMQTLMEPFGKVLSQTEKGYLTGQTGEGPDTWNTKDYADRIAMLRNIKQREFDRFLKASVIEYGFEGPNTPKPKSRSAAPAPSPATAPSSAAPTSQPDDDDWNNIPSIQ